MNNSIKGNNSEEVTIQLKKAEVQKKILIKNIYKEYEIYFQIVRKSIISSAKKGIFGLFSNLSISDKSLNSSELINFLNKNISLLIQSKLPLITIEQLKLRNINYPPKRLVNKSALNELVEFKEYKDYQFVNWDYENELINKEPLEFYCNNYTNSYEHYKSHSEDEYLSLNLDDSVYSNSFSKYKSFKNIEDQNHIFESVLELIEDTNDNKFNHSENMNDQVSDVFISSDNLKFFENIDKTFSYFLFNLSYEINSELFKINLIKKNISEDKFKYLSDNNYTIKHPKPFVIKYDVNQEDLSADNNKFFDFYLFNISNVELEFFNLDLSICRNNINELKNKFRSLNKKHKYWKNKELSLNNLN